MVLADAEGVEADLIGQHGLLDDLAQHAGVRLQADDRIEGDVAEGVDTEGERGSHAIDCTARRPCAGAAARLARPPVSRSRGRR